MSTLVKHQTKCHLADLDSAAAAPEEDEAPPPEPPSRASGQAHSLRIGQIKFPNHAVTIFQWGNDLANNGCEWPNRPTFHTAADVEDWHKSTFGANTINPQSKTDLEAIDENIGTPLQLPDNPVVLNHLDNTIQNRPYDAFSMCWRALDASMDPQYLDIQGPPRVWRISSDAALCKKTTAADAEYMNQHNNLNLALSPDVWHHAVLNPNNKETMDFIATNGGAPAITLGANIQAWLVADINDNWPQPVKKYLLPDKLGFFTAGFKKLRNINPPDSTVNENLLHHVVDRLHVQSTSTKFRNKVTASPRNAAVWRKKLTDHAIQMIHHIRRGNRYGQPSLARTDANNPGRTALDLAHDHEILGLDNALKATATVNGTSHTNPGNPTTVPGHRYPLRRTTRI
ncbi:hypothetical protein BDW74DRAFT_182792 [Aspergillus multicolor]|uniref:uncharacterized protein n=1 Tax=Aspergillus multicolor TaxID=41759 RepID=UPI003CCC97F4